MRVRAHSRTSKARCADPERLFPPGTAAGLPSKPTLPSGSSSSILASSSSNGLREGGGGGRTAPGRPAWNPAPAVGSLDDRPARERGDRNDRGDRRRRGGDDDDETPAWMRAEAGSDGLEKGGSRKGRTRTGDDTEAFGGGGGLGGSRRREEKAGPAPSPAGDDKRDGEDAIMRFKREMRERDGLSAPPQESATSTTTPAATESAKPVSTGMFDHLTRPPPKTANSAPLLPPSSAPGSGLFRDPAILSSPAASPSIASASVVGTVGGQKRAPGGSRFAKFFTEEPKKTPAGAPAPAQQMASPPMGGQASPQVGNLMSILAGGGGSPIPSQQQQQHSQQRPVEENDQMNKLLAMLQSSHVRLAFSALSFCTVALSLTLPQSTCRRRSPRTRARTCRRFSPRPISTSRPCLSAVVRPLACRRSCSSISTSNGAGLPRLPSPTSSTKLPPAVRRSTRRAWVAIAPCTTTRRCRRLSRRDGRNATTSKSCSTPRPSSGGLPTRARPSMAEVAVEAIRSISCASCSRWAAGPAVSAWHRLLLSSSSSSTSTAASRSRLRRRAGCPRPMRPRFRTICSDR